MIHNEKIIIPTNEDRHLEFRKIHSLDDKYEINSNGTILRNISLDREIKIKLDSHHSKLGYYSAHIFFNKKVKRLSIASLVAECWLGKKPSNEYSVDHIDRNPHNNDYHNLRYATVSEQMKNRTLPEEFLNRVTKNLNGKLPVKTKITRIKDKNYSSVSNQGTNDLIEEKLFQSMNACSKFLVNYSTDNVRTIYHKISKLQKGKIKRLIIGPYEIKIN